MGAAKTAAESYKLKNVITSQTDETSDLFPTGQLETAKTNALRRAFALDSPAFRQNPDSKTNVVYLTGISTVGGRVVVYLSNGEVFTSEDRELEFISKRFAVINGRRFTFPPPSSQREGANPERRSAYTPLF